MKKLIALLLVLTMLFSVATVFAGCEDKGSKKSASSKNDDEEEEETEDSGDENTEGEEENKETEGDGQAEDDPDEQEDPTENGDTDEVENPTEPAEDAFDDTDGNGPLLYKVSDDEGNVIWLFGSIHVGREDYYPLPEYVMDAFEGSDALAVEADILEAEDMLSGGGDQSELLSLAMKMMYTDGTTIADHISEETYEMAVEILNDGGQYNYMMDYFKPVFWSMLIDNVAVAEAGGDANLGIDRFLLTTAKESGMEILEVESMEFQYNMLFSFSAELQIYMLENSVEAYADLDEYAQTLEEMMDLWYSGNEAAFAKYLADDSEADPEYAALMEEYNNAMIVERNQSMTEYAVDALESGEEIFICVGAAHVVGEDAMADNLRELGYTVEIVR